MVTQDSLISNVNNGKKIHLHATGSDAEFSTLKRELQDVEPGCFISNVTVGQHGNRLSLKLKGFQDKSKITKIVDVLNRSTLTINEAPEIA